MREGKEKSEYSWISTEKSSSTHERILGVGKEAWLVSGVVGIHFVVQSRRVQYI